MQLTNRWVSRGFPIPTLEFKSTDADLISRHPVWWTPRTTPWSCICFLGFHEGIPCIFWWIEEVLGPQPRFFFGQLLPSSSRRSCTKLPIQGARAHWNWKAWARWRDVAGCAQNKLWSTTIQNPSKIRQKSVKNPSNSVRVHQCHGLPGTRKANVFSVGTYSAPHISLVWMGHAPR